VTRRHRTRAGGGPPRHDLARAARVTPGAWLYTCRAGFEGDLVDELGPRAAVLAPALVVAPGDPPRRGAHVEVIFGRQGMRVLGEATGARPELLARVTEIVVACAAVDRPWTLHAWVPDTDAENRLASEAQALFAAVSDELGKRAPDVLARRTTADVARREQGSLVQLCLRDAGHVVVGQVPAHDALSLAPGGRERMRVPSDAPARSAMKLAEAFAWLGLGPEPGELCADLGAAPGGWTRVLLERRARVVAIDPAELAPEIARQRGVTHVKRSAFEHAPEEPVDWLCCDMAWRPLEAAALLAKWGRRRWARALVANVKLPVKKKVEMLTRVRAILEEGGWRDVRMRHLYHDRDEATVAAWLR